MIRVLKYSMHYKGMLVLKNMQGVCVLVCNLILYLASGLTFIKKYYSVALHFEKPIVSLLSQECRFY